ncbi:hypothetical protein M3O96_02125 [Aquiflexum sp. TKW24L]|uniref:hypothetical protein n=1 Tax=Aquiflexum sp. TKW24L TaxID=2942212 RepID=UPI0020C14411|nr:hypothetical protein [Aquiflexum sp. TKW24L]MCL6257868.1 hypothetical protein [Aquiflexum sp. TKW24L]
MKHLRIFFILLLLVGCNDGFERQKIIGEINDQVAYLDMEIIEGDSLGFVFELQTPGNFQNLSVIDPDLICDSLSVNDCYNWHSFYPRRPGMKLLYHISGEVLSPNPNEKRVGKPFILTKAERILSCPVDYRIVPGEVALNEKVWKMIGFVDNDDQIYSHPACESNNMRIQFSDVLLDDYPFNLPGGKRVEVRTGDYLFSLSGREISYSVIENSNKIRLKYLSSPFFIPGFRNYVQHDGPRTLQTKQKSDSLLRLLSTDTLDYMLENNILKLSNPKSKLNAMFVAN